MQSERIKRGETFSFSAEFVDIDGAAVAVDDTWSFGLRICKGGIGGETFVDVPVTTANGNAVASYSTDDLEPGIYYYDLRYTQPGSTEEWNDPAKLIIDPTNTPYT